MSQSLIFITGTTGFIGSHVASQALDAGYKLRISVRKESQIDTLRNLFSKHADQLDFVVIPDLSRPDAFTSALQDVTYVFHVASPMPGQGVDFEKDYLAPAVKGTTALLDAAKGVNTIKRVIIVSSLLSFMPLGALASTESITVKEGVNPSLQVDPNMSFPEDPQVNAALKYHASKILAHRATLDWAASHQPSFNIISLHPSFVFGRSLTQTSAAALDGSNGMLWVSLTSPQPLMPMAAVDVRDVAHAHIKALDVHVGATGQVEEFSLSAGEKEGWSWTGVAQFAQEKYPAVGVELERAFGGAVVTDTQRAEQLLGVRWKPMQDTVSAFLDHQVELQGQA